MCIDKTNNRQPIVLKCISDTEKSYGDIRLYKRELRDRIKAHRKAMDTEIKDAKDQSIFERVIALDAYQKADLIIPYVSTPIEVDTQKLIRHSLAIGKTVAVPKCVPSNCSLDIYVIRSFSDLEQGTFSVMEPKPHCQKLTNFARSLCIVPGLSFDLHGYRLGYGKGYYDRFLSAYYAMYKVGADSGNEVIGLCYCASVVNKLHHGRYDLPVRVLVTEKFTKRIK